MPKLARPPRQQRQDIADARGACKPATARDRLSGRSSSSSSSYSFLKPGIRGRGRRTRTITS